MLDSHISKSQAQLSAALQLQSSATLGTGKASTHKDILDKQEDKEVRRAIDGTARHGKRGRGKTSVAQTYDDESGSEAEDDVLGDARPNGSHEDGEVGSSRANPVVIVDAGFSTATLPPEDDHVSAASSVPQVGSALKRNADGSVVAPKVAKRKPKGSKV